jgi:hypothetical protein
MTITVGIIAPRPLTPSGANHYRNLALFPDCSELFVRSIEPTQQAPTPRFLTLTIRSSSVGPQSPTGRTTPINMDQGSLVPESLRERWHVSGMGRPLQRVCPDSYTRFHRNIKSPVTAMFHVDRYRERRLPMYMVRSRK